MGTSRQHGSKRDVVLIHGVDAKRKELHVLRRTDETVQAAVVREAEPGMPIHGDLVKLSPHPGFPLLCDVETLLADPARPEAPARSGHPGPAIVASEAYRRGWDDTFGRRADRIDGELAN
jgi:hypothetical protein